MMDFLIMVNLTLYPVCAVCIFMKLINDMFLRDRREIKTLKNRLIKALHGGINESELQQITMLTSWDSGKVGE